MKIVERKTYSGVDLFKFIMAILVVAIHTRPLMGFEQFYAVKLWEQLLKFAVPYFFMASGYFLFLKFDSGTSREIKLSKIYTYGKRILQLYLLWTLIYLPITVIETFNNDLSLLTDLALFIRGVLFVGESYYSWPLWYLLSMIYSLSIIYFLIKIKLNLKAIFFISVVIYLISIFFNYLTTSKLNYGELAIGRTAIEYTFGNGRIFSGTLYIMIGAMLAVSAARLSAITLITFSLLSVVFQVYEVPVLSELTFILIRVVAFVLSLRLVMPSTFNGLFFRKASTALYFLHMIVFYCYIMYSLKYNYFGLIPFMLAVAIPILLTPLILKYERSSNILGKLF